MPQKDYLGSERRKYIRLDTVFPVQFRLLSLDGRRFLSEWLQGFTNDVGKGGLCLSVNNLHADLAQSLKGGQAKLSLEIQMPINAKAVSAIGRVAWIKDILGEPNKYIIGLSYEDIDRRQNSKIMRYAWMKKLFVPLALTVILILGLGFTINSFINAKLVQGNKALVEQLVRILQDSSVAKQKVKQINKERRDLEIKIQAMESRIQTIEEEKSKLEEAKGDEIKRLNSMVEDLVKKKDDLEKDLTRLHLEENTVTEELLRLDKKKATLEKANLDKMYEWLKIHQNPRTGLVMSFEGDRDIEKWAFTYDQALALQAYTNFSDFERAKKTLDFFQKKAKRIEAGFLNAYYVQDGAPAEYTVHSGPNIWLGIAIVQYTYKSKDRSYMGLAEEIAQSMIHLQNQSQDGGIRGGPNIEWFATEHNLDAYAFFNMLYKVTGKPEYISARDKVLNWLVQHTYDKGEIPIKRGKGDSTIATDTYAWSIAAIGPEKLEEIGMNPDMIMEFVEKNCCVEVSFTRPEGRSIKIKGFDFAPQRHLARGGVVSSEWTAQMVLALRIMSDFYYKKGMVAKARSYELKADECLAQLGNMVISSPSPSGQGESCLPYATQDFVDTGHGWMTPKGSRTGSVAGTAYTIFAYYKYNPLELRD
jgi:TolA-binding protein